MRKIALLGLCMLLVTTAVFSAGGREEAPQKFEVLYFVGGMGQMADYAVEKLRQNNPNVTVELEYNHRAHDVLRNKMMTGDTPDVFMINKGLYSHYGAIAEGLLGSVEYILDAPTYDGTGTLRDRIVSTNLEGIGLVDGTHYLIPEVSYLGGLWYDEKMFNDLGITVPETWEQFIEACEILKNNGITPLGYLGDFAHEYPLSYFFLPMLVGLDPQGYADIQNLVPGAWQTDAVSEVLSRIEYMRDNGYIWPPSVAAGIEVQMELVRGNIGFYPCGSWLHAEMQDSWPEDFVLRFIPVPTKTASGGTNYVFTTDLVGSVPAEPRNREMTIEYYQYLLSDPDTIAKTITANQFVMPLVGFAEDFGHLLPAPVTSAVQAVDDNPTFTSMWGLWYSELPNEAGNAINALVAGNITADQFIQRMERASERIRNDDDIPKYVF